MRPPPDRVRGNRSVSQGGSSARSGFEIGKLASSGAQDRLEPNFQSIAAEGFCEVPLYVAPHFEVFAQVVVEHIVPVASFVILHGRAQRLH